MIHIAPKRLNGSGWLAWWNIHAESASEPTFFSPERMVSSAPPVAT
jgi:hypothetical protein